MDWVGLACQQLLLGSRSSHRRATANASSGNAGARALDAVHHLVHQRLVLEAVAALARRLDDRAPQAGARQRAERREIGEDAGERCVVVAPHQEVVAHGQHHVDVRLGRDAATSVATWACVSDGFKVKSSSNWSKTTSAVAVGLAPASQHSERHVRIVEGHQLRSASRSVVSSGASACPSARSGEVPGVHTIAASPPAAPEAHRRARTRSCRLRRADQGQQRPRANSRPERDDFLLAPEEHRRIPAR